MKMNGCLSWLGTILVALAIADATVTFNYYQCKAKTADMGFKSKWSLLAGCRIEHKPDTWIPIERYRVIED